MKALLLIKTLMQVLIYMIASQIGPFWKRGILRPIRTPLRWRNRLCPNYRWQYSIAQLLLSRLIKSAASSMDFWVSLLTPHSSLREVVSLPLAFMVSARSHDGHCFGGMAWSEGVGAKHCTISHEVAAMERTKIKMRTRKLWIGLAWNDSVTNLPKASTFVCCVSMEDDCAIPVGCSSAWETLED